MTRLPDALATLRVQLEESRTAQQVSESELARRMGVSQPRVHEILKGRYDDMRLSTLTRVASALGFDVDITLR